MIERNFQPKPYPPGPSSQPGLFGAPVPLSPQKTDYDNEHEHEKEVGQASLPAFDDEHDENQPESGPEGATRYAFLVSYDGAPYAGWQYQTNGLSIQQVVEEAAGKLTGAPVRVMAAGRTDSGVHALGQVASFKVPHGPQGAPRRVLAPKNIVMGMNHYLPPAIRVLGARIVPESFDPRKDARLRHYRYWLIQGGSPPGVRARLARLDAIANQLGLACPDARSFSGAARLRGVSKRPLPRQPNGSGPRTRGTKTLFPACLLATPGNWAFSPSLIFSAVHSSIRWSECWWEPRLRWAGGK